MNSSQSQQFGLNTVYSARVWTKVTPVLLAGLISMQKKVCSNVCLFPVFEWANPSTQFLWVDTWSKSNRFKRHLAPGYCTCGNKGTE